MNLKSENFIYTFVVEECELGFSRLQINKRSKYSHKFNTFESLK